jgi:hypothetical protein
MFASLNWDDFELCFCGFHKAKGSITFIAEFEGLNIKLVKIPLYVLLCTKNTKILVKIVTK